jgi:sulfoxide reductase catalytic subunit YedY
MHVHLKPSWNIPESQVTPSAIGLDRRTWLLANMAPALVSSLPKAQAGAGIGFGSPPTPNPAHQAPESLSDFQKVSSFTNFFEFGAGKNIREHASRLPLSPWTLTIDGLVKQTRTLGIDDLLKRMPLEERIYRHRCIEAWSMVVPWSGFALRDLLALAEPLGDARYVSFTTFGRDKHFSPGFWRFWHPWPYVEGLTMAEASSELPFVATGLYGHPLKPQNGAPIRLVLPWKYGFKSIKSIVKISFHAQRPLTFWERARPAECGFWANVNPEVPHPHWSQATEQRLGATERIPTRLFNGYGNQVAHLYSTLHNEALWR